MENATHLLPYSVFRRKRKRSKRRTNRVVYEWSFYSKILTKPFKWRDVRKVKSSFLVACLFAYNAPMEYLNRIKLSSRNVTRTVLLSNINV